MAGGRDAYELNVEHDPRDNRFAVGDSPSRQSGREFVSGGRIGDWRENRARHNEIRKDFYRWQSAKATADKLAREYIEAKESVRPGIADKRFERFQTARKALRDFAEELGFGGLADESGKRWKRFQRLFGDDPESGTPRVFADETDHKITGDIPGRTSGDSTSAKDDESTATEEAYRAAAVWENYCFAETEPDRIKAADELIEYMENLGLDDLSNWESFAGNWSHPHKNLFFGRIAEAAAEYFDLPLDQLEAAADEVAISQNGKASFGEATTRDYRKTFRDAYPDTRGRVVVHHAVEQGVLSKFPGVVSPSEIHSLENLRGIPKGSVNNEVHLSAIRREWNRFYKPFLRDGTRPTKQELLDFATYIDDKYGDQFNPPIR